MSRNKKNKIILTAVLLLAMGVLTACGKEGEYLKDVNADKYVKLGEYKGIAVEVEVPEITDEYLDSYIDYIVSSSSVDRSVQDGDYVNLDFEGKVDGVAFEGGTAQGYDLGIGSGSFIPGFESGMIGMEVGEVRDVAVTFPEDYSSEELAGADAVFTVTLNYIYGNSAVDLTDEFVKNLQITGCETVADLRQYLYDGLTSQNETTRQEAMIEQIMQSSEFKNVPEAMVTRMTDSMTTNLSEEAAAMGMDLTTYISSYYGLTEATVEEEIRKQSETMIKRYLMLQAIADKEGWGVSEEYINEQLLQTSQNMGFDDVEAYTEAIDVEAYKEYLMTQNVIKNLMEHVEISQ